eukprot:m.156639 g.156639  ORF g.156639 m.156639 type:complete len:671 (+) comp14329_c0_seq2:268-2280(+)
MAWGWWSHAIEKLGRDWIVLTLMGVLVALVGFGLDFTIHKLHEARDLLCQDLSVGVYYLAWTSFSVLCVVSATAATWNIAPEAEGSGIPQMKVILQGVPIKSYLLPRTLLAKVVGLLLAVGSGLPIGKEGPFVHIGSIIGEKLHRLLFKSVELVESRHLEILAAACSVGVASNFGSPIGGVLFSIEVTSTYFALRNYWRGFYAAVVGAFTFRLLAVVVKNEATITAVFTTTFDAYPFDLAEMLGFAFVGVACGILAALFIFLHRKLFEVFSSRTQSATSRYVFSALVSFFIATVMFPGLFGSYMGLAQNQAIDGLFTTEPLRCREEWTSTTTVVTTLALFVTLKFFLTAFAITLPVPAGVFVPVFVLGAAFGRLIGEAMVVWFPEGILANQGNTPPIIAGPMCTWQSQSHIVPGGYAVVGAAALAAGVTHTISTSVIVFELTGQIHHILPVMIAVLISNAVCQALSPSIYDSIIQLRNLPFLPDLRNRTFYSQTAAMIMRQNPLVVSQHCTFGDIKQLLRQTDHSVFPLVDSKASMLLLGSVNRSVLQTLVSDPVPGSDHRVIDLSHVQIDPSPYQMVQETTLFKIHRLFSMIGIQLAYVTHMGRLVGVVSVKEVRDCITALGVRRFERSPQRSHPTDLIHFVTRQDDQVQETESSWSFQSRDSPVLNMD